MFIKSTDLTIGLNDILAENESREAVSAWAHSVMQAYDGNALIFVAPKDEEVIWCGLGYLVFVGAVELNQSYVYSEIDV